ncbi:alpha/beta-hydrolase [Russula dissimulans]|nr:alpha/beta-hydrolase [Russula dissimulans]
MSLLFSLTLTLTNSVPSRYIIPSLLRSPACWCSRSSARLLQTAEASFNPRAYPNKVVTCPAINRAENTSVNIDLHYVQVNPKAEKTLLFLHGWPSLWASWKYQIQEFQDDYHLIVPNLRGFGASSHPGDVKSSGTMPDLVGDLLCILNHVGVPNVIVIGHDWGAQLAYEAARERPDVFTAVVGITIPVTARPLECTPRKTEHHENNRQTPAAVAELNRDIRRTLRTTLRNVASPPPEVFLTSKDTFMGTWDSVDEVLPIPFFSTEEEDYWVEQYNINGFDHTLVFYTKENTLASWKFANDQGNHTIPQPILSILPTEDPVANMELVAKLLRSFDFLPNHSLHTLPAAHWPQLEKPTEVNAIIRKWLTELDIKQERPRDEL